MTVALLLPALSTSIRLARAGFAATMVTIGLIAQGPTAAFWTAAPAPVDALSTASSELSVSICLDGKQAWITSNRPGGAGGFDIWWATRANSQASWSAPALSALSTTQMEWYAEISEDGLELFFARAPGLAASDLFQATRTNPAQDFAPASVTPVAAANTTADEIDPCLSADALTLYFTSDRAGTQLSAIFKVTRANRSSPFANPVIVVDTPLYDHSPAIGRGDNLLHFAVDIDGNNSDYRAVWRESVAGAFGPVAIVQEMQTPGWEEDGHFARHDSEFWLASDWTTWGGLPSDSIYRFHRLVPGLAADRDAVPAASGGAITLTAAEDASITSVQLLLLSFTRVAAIGVPGIAGQLVLDPARFFVLGSGSGVATDGIVHFPLAVPPGLPAGARLHFQTLRLDLISGAPALSMHESVGIQ